MEHQVNRQVIGVVVAFTAGAVALILKFVGTAPFLFAGLLAFLCCVFLSFSFNRSRFWGALFRVLGIALLVGGAAEAYFSWFGTSLVGGGEIKTQEWMLEGESYYVDDEARGYAARPSSKKRIRKSLKDQVIYDVVYTIDRQGLRVAPHDVGKAAPEQEDAAQDVVFVGDSFIFGEGLNDREAIPYRFEELSGGSVRAYNFGFHGYGAHQMLRLIETGELAKVVPEGRRLVVVYGALLQHVERASGKMIWDAKVPRYVLSPSGAAVYAGTFADDPAVAENLERSRRLADPRARLVAGLSGPARTRDDVRLYLRLVLQARDALAARYRARFVVLLWRLGDPDAAEVTRELAGAGIEVITVDDIYRDYPDPPESYRIALDDHPTALAADRIAAHLRRLLL